MKENLSEQELLRREKKLQLEELGINPYPAEEFKTTFSIPKILSEFDENSPEEFKNVILAGRIMNKRVMGSASFAELMDDGNRIQLYLHRDSLCPEEDKTLYNTVFKKLIDIGDIVGVGGYVFKTKVGEISIYVQTFKLLSKSLKPLPIVKESNQGDKKKTHDAFTDPENRYRQRYVDLLVNPNVREVFKKRSKIINSIREYFKGLGCLEVETPTLQPVYGGAFARPFTTYHNTLDMDFFLRISNELYLKRLIVGGYNGVFEFAKLFRNEGMSRFHNPEFTSVEAYIAYKDYLWMIDHTEKMISQLVFDLYGENKIKTTDYEIDFSTPWQRYTMFEAIEKFTGIDISDMDEEQLRTTAKELDIFIDKAHGKAKIIDEIFGDKCEPYLINPTVIMDYPIEMSPLAKTHRDHPELVERFEVICNGKEVCNAYSELNDPIDQRERFEKQLKLAQRGDDEAMSFDEDFLRALEYGMPPTVGIGFGIDRLTMILANVNSIQEVIFFPHMKPEHALK